MFVERQLDRASATLNLAAGPNAGPPLLLLHGVLRQWTDFTPILPTFVSRWHVHALDFRGHGESSRVAGKYRVADYVEDAVRAVESINDPVVIYGHSLGAMVAAAAAAARPEHVRGLILEDPPFETMGERQHQTALQSLFEGYQQCLAAGRDVNTLTDRLAQISLSAPGQDPAQATRLGDLRDRAALRFAAAGLAKIDPEVLAPIVAGKWLEGFDRDAVIQGIRCPTLVLQADGAVGGMLTDGDAARLDAAVTDCSVVRFPGVGHLIHWSATAPLLSATTAFLASLR